MKRSMTTKEICKSFISDVHCSAITVNPIEPVPVDDFLEEIKTLDFYHHGKDRGEGWSSVCVHGVEEQLTDHPDKYNIENPEYKWCIEDKAPILTNYFKNNFYKEIKYKRIRVMRLDPNGVIRPHSDSKKNHCYGTINIELGPTKAEYCCLCRMGKQNLDNSIGRAYLFNNTIYHTVMNKSKEYRYQIIVHFENDHNFEVLKSIEKYERGVWGDLDKADVALYFSTGPAGKHYGVPKMESDLEKLKSNKKGFFLHSSVDKRIKIGKENLYTTFNKWATSNNFTIKTDKFCFWNPDKPADITIPINYKEVEYDESKNYWTYTTDPLVEYITQLDGKKDFDYIIAPSTGTSLEYLSIQFKCKNLIGYNYNIESNIIHEEIRNTLRLENNMKAWEGFERLTERIVEKHNFVFFTNVNAKSGTRHLFINIDPPQFFDTVCTANYQYEIINIIEQPESLLPYIEGKKIVLNISNIFGFIDSVKKYSLKELKNSWENLMKVLEKSKYTYFIGEDYFKVNKRIRINYDL